MSKINEIIPIPDRLFSGTLKSYNQYYDLLINNYKSHFKSNCWDFFGMFKSEFLKSLNDEYDKMEFLKKDELNNGYDLNSFSSIQLFKFISMATHFYLLGLGENQKKKIIVDCLTSENNKYCEFTLKYLDVFNQFLVYLDSYYDGLSLNSEMIEGIVENVFNNYVKIFPVDSISNGFNGFDDFKKEFKSEVRKVCQERFGVLKKII